MHVLFISDVYFPRVNGVSTSIQTFALQFLEKGHRVTLIAPQYPAEFNEPFEILRIKSRRVPLDAEDRLMQRCHIRSRYAQIAALAPDLVHIQTPFAAHYEGLRLARHLGVPVVESYHTYFEHYLESYLPLLPRTFLRWLARQASRAQCRQVDALVAPTRPMAEVLQRYGVERGVHVIPTGIPSRAFAAGDGERFRRRHGIAADRPLLLFVGRVAFEKNIGFLLDVAAAVRRRKPDILLVIAGEGPASAALERQCARLGLQRNVRFVGYLSREQALADCYAAADLFVFASRTETQGLVLLEAMAAGLPVVTTGVLGTAEVMADGRGGILCEEQTEAFTAAVTALLSDPAARARLAAEARAKADLWSDSHHADRLLALYRNLTSAAPDLPGIAAER